MSRVWFFFTNGKDFFTKSSLGQMFDRKQISEHTWASLFFKCTWRTQLTISVPKVWNRRRSKLRTDKCWRQFGTNRISRINVSSVRFCRATDKVQRFLKFQMYVCLGWILPLSLHNAGLMLWFGMDKRKKKKNLVRVKKASLFGLKTHVLTKTGRKCLQVKISSGVTRCPGGCNNTTTIPFTLCRKFPFTVIS